MFRRLAILLVLLLQAPLLAAEEIVLGLSKDQVAITANFNGSDLLIFGAIRRDEPVADLGRLGIIIAVSGPAAGVTVRRKERRFGLWLNTSSVEVDLAPSFYAVASSGELSEVLKDIEDLRHGITLERAIRSVGNEVVGSEQFTEALIRIRSAGELYQVLEGAVHVEEETLFNAAITLPSNLTEGDYSTRIFLTRDGLVVDEYDTVIPVNKVGLERWLFEMAGNQPAIYGALSLVLAVAAGWGASALFAALRR